MNITPITVDLWNLGSKQREVRINIGYIDMGDVSGSLLDIWYCGTGSWEFAPWHVSVLYWPILQDFYYRFVDKYFPGDDAVDIEVPPAPMPAKKGKKKK